MYGIITVGFIALIGYYIFFVVLLNQKEAFFPVCFIAATVMLIYFFGCMDLLSMGGAAAIMLGICMLVISILFLCKKKKNPEIHTFINPTLIFMFGGIVWCYVISRGIYPSHYDDFSHWLKICKTMYADGTYPNTVECFFQNYVPGTATWIWFVVSIIGYTPQNCYFAQMIMNLSCCAALLSVLDKEHGFARKAVITTACVVLSVLLCSMDITVYSLLVDGILGLAASAAVIYCAASEKEGSGVRRFLILLIMCSFVALIKASGSFLVFFVAIVYFASVSGIKAKNGRIKGTVFSLAVVIIPFVNTFFYMARARRIFGSQTWKQGSVNAYADFFSLRGENRYVEITKRFFKECFDLINAWPQIRMLWVVILTVIVLCMIDNRKKNTDKQWKFVSIYIPAVIVLWLVGVLFTFFTFGEQEANADKLISLERYTGTVVIIVVAILSYYLLRRFSATDDKKLFFKGVCGLTVISVFAGLLVGFHLDYVLGFEYYDFKMFTTDAWRYLEEYYPERWDFNDDGYVMLIDVEQKDYDNYYKLYHVLVTYFRTTNCNVYDIKDLENSGFSIDDVREVFPNIVYYY